MRFIAVLGVLFVLASCSDSDMKENFSVSCNLDLNNYPNLIAMEGMVLYYDFDLQENTVDVSYSNFSEENVTKTYAITKKTDSFIKFSTDQGNYFFDRTTLIMKTSFGGMSGDPSWRQCQLPQV